MFKFIKIAGAMHSGNIFFKYFKLFLREGLRILEIISGEKGEGGRFLPEAFRAKSSISILFLSSNPARLNRARAMHSRQNLSFHPRSLPGSLPIEEELFHSPGNRARAMHSRQSSPSILAPCQECIAPTPGATTPFYPRSPARKPEPIEEKLFHFPRKIEDGRGIPGKIFYFYPRALPA